MIYIIKYFNCVLWNLFKFADFGLEARKIGTIFEKKNSTRYYISSHEQPM